MANYFNTLNLRQQLAQLGKCRFMGRDEFADGASYLQGKKVVIVGCGAQGLNQGLNMRDSGLDISYALRKEAIAEKRASWRKATENGFKVGTYEELIPQADLVVNLTPDKQHSDVVRSVQPLMKDGAALGYSHGFNIVEVGEQIRKDITVVMVAPKCPGTEVPAYNQIAIVNPQLKPERARGVDLTWNGAFTHDWGFEVSVYYNRVSDAILSHNIDADTIQNQNSGTVDYSGLDAGIKGKISNILDVGLSYALIHADAKRKDIGKITDLPTQTMTAWMTLKPWEPLSVTLSEEARSSSYSNSDGSQKAAGFAVTHIRADYTLGHGFSVNASVNNLFDTKYAYSEGFIEEGRNFWAGIEYTF